jgi:hypothetical protein
MHPILEDKRSGEVEEKNLFVIFQISVSDLALDEMFPIEDHCPD